MHKPVTELFLNTFFLADKMAGPLVDSPKILFDALYPSFLLPEAERCALYAATQVPVVREVKTYDDYAQITRIQKFTALVGSGVVADKEYELLSDEEYELVTVKGNALKKIRQAKLDEYFGGTEAAACKLISDTANTGWISSLCLFGFLQCEGIYFTQNERLGRANLEKAAQWNSLEGILLALRYDADNRQRNLDRLRTVTAGTIYEGIVAAAQKAYGVGAAKEVPENVLLQKAFGVEPLKSEVYAPQYARFLFSEVLSLRDKEHILLSGNQGGIAETADLPLGLVYGELAFDESPFIDLPIARPQEQKRIVGIAQNADFRGDAAYLPLCVVSDSDYLRGLYMDAVGRAFPSAHIETVEVAELNEYDFEPTKANIFVRSCDEESQNIYLLVFRGEISEGVFELVRTFLQSGKRGEFRLQHPSVAVDLRAVLPICFCDMQNARRLKKYCDTVTLAAVTEAEKSKLLPYIAQEKAKKHKIADLRIHPSAQSVLLAYNIDKIDYSLDRIARNNRNAQTLAVTAETVQEIAAQEPVGKNRYGFGGGENGD